MNHFAFLLGVGILGLIWSVFFFTQKYIRTKIIYGGVLYAVLLLVVFIIHRIIYSAFLFSEMYNPAYWNPPTLLNLDNLTGGLSIEGMLFGFFAAGIVAAVFGMIAPDTKKLTRDDSYRALFAFMVVYFFLGFTLKPNPIYLLIFASLCGALFIFYRRCDFVKPAFLTAFIFSAVYILAFLIFTKLSPDFIKSFYNLNSLSRIYLTDIPIEELLYAFSFSLFWGPLTNSSQ